MKIYLGLSGAEGRPSFGAARNIVRTLKEMGHDILPRHLLSDVGWEADGTKPAVFWAQPQNGVCVSPGETSDADHYPWQMP